MSKSIKVILPLIAILAFLAAGAFFLFKLSAAEGDAKEEIAQAERELAAEEQINAGLAIDSPESSEQIEAVKTEIIDGLKKDLATLESELAELDAAITEAEGRLAEACRREDYEYYKAVYDSLLEGKKEVEEYIADAKE